MRSNNSSALQILLAESDTFKIAQVKAYLTQLPFSVQVCQTYSALMPTLKMEIPAALLLGSVNDFNLFVASKKCHLHWKHLPIILLSSNTTIDEQLHQAAIAAGATDIVPNNLLDLNRLLLELLQLKAKDTTDTTITVQKTMLGALKEITQVGNNYFGGQPQGNYLRKAHAILVTEFPALQNWSADHFGIISCNETIWQSQLTEEDLYSLQKWVSLYINDCERIIIDYRKILKESNLSPAAIKLLPQ